MARYTRARRRSNLTSFKYRSRRKLRQFRRRRYR